MQIVRQIYRDIARPFPVNSAFGDKGREEQILSGVREHDGVETADLYHKDGINETTGPPLEEAVGRARSVEGQVAPGAGERGCQAEEALGKSASGQTRR